MNKKNNVKKDWWTEEYGYFGEFYMIADMYRDANKNKELDLRKRTKKEVDGLINLLDLKIGNKLMDCPCGYGRHSIELAKRGYEIIGIDLNTKHLDKARKDSNNIKGVQFIEKNMLNLSYINKFDALVNLFASFGFFYSDKENKKVLKNFYTSLKNGGKFMMHIDINISKMINGPQRHESKKKLINGDLLKIVDVYDPITKKLNGSWTISNKNNKKTKEYSVRIYTKEEFEKLCKEVGFKSIKTYGDWSGSNYSTESNDMIVIATK